MKGLSWTVKLGIGLLLTSVVLFAIHLAIFQDFHHIAIYTLHDIAFLPVEVLIVTMIIHSLLERRARQEMMNKLNMVIGAFFSEVGSELLRRISELDEEVEVREYFLVNGHWDAARYQAAKKAATDYDFGIKASREDLAALSAFLDEKRGFLLGMLQNPSLLEHESFTEAMWGVFHLNDELSRRRDFVELLASDVRHLSGDVERAYRVLALEWLDYVQHLQKDYPYLFSLAVRTNPLNSGSSVAVTG